MVLEISNITSLTPGTPQDDAFQWLANEDGARVCPEDDRDVTQRYVMAVLYFSTEGDSWTNCSATQTSDCVSDSTRFLNSQNVCFWFGVTCRRDDIVIISIGKERDLCLVQTLSL